MKNENIHVRFPKELKDRLKEICDKKSINLSDWFRKQAEKFVKENE